MAREKTKNKRPPKFHRDLVAYAENHGGKLVAGRESPICLKCQLDAEGARHPYVKSNGPAKPVITIVTEGISKGEDEADCPGVDGTAGLLAGLVKKLAAETGLDLDQVRWVPLTRCCARTGLPNYKTKGNWCRWHLVEDLIDNRPQLIMPVGTTALGALCHKSNAQDWGGRLLTYRGWPDDWLTGPFKDGHPLFPKPGPHDRTPMFPVQAPRLIYMTQNPHVIRRWRDQVKKGLSLAVSGVMPNVYDRPWWRLVTDPDVIQAELESIPPGTDLHFDTETNGFYAFRENSAIVLFMFRWEQDGQARAIGFPWDYEGSPMRAFIPRLTPCVLDLLYRSRIHGHNLGFDILFAYGTLSGANLIRLTQAMAADLWHMLYTLKQERGSLGLELVAYDWAPSLAGYEEDMVLLIQRLEQLQPDKGGHYANCPPELWDSHLKPYIMGDVEVLAEAVPTVRERLQQAKRYRIPLAHTEVRSKFRYYEPPGREWVYDNLMSRSARLLTRLMGRGMYVDVDELTRQEDLFPKAIRGLRDVLKNVDSRIIDWHEQMVKTKEGWEFDLEKSDQLKTILFDLLKLPVKRLTKAGIRKFGENPENLTYEELRRFATIDKFTLNLLAAEHPGIQPLIDYRKTFKAYTAFVRPIRNSFAKGVDKHNRLKMQHLMRDMCVHASFNQCGTGGGRLSCSNPNLQQLPRDSTIKRMYKSRFGDQGCIYQGDLSQIELRLLAAACGDPSMVKAYWDRVDLHSLTTSLIFNVPYEHFSKDYATWLQTHGRDKEAKELDLKRKIGKCVAPESIVEVNGRLMRIEAVHPGRAPDTFYPVNDIKVKSPHGNVSITNFYSNGDSDRLLICARHGLVMCSPRHRFLTEDGRLIMASDLKEGDILAPVTPLSGPFDPPAVRVDHDLAYLLGLFYGDGCSNLGTVAIATGGKSEYFTWQDEIAAIASRCGFEPRVERTTWNHEVDGPKIGYDQNGDEIMRIHGSAGRVIFGSTRVSDLFVQLGVVNDEQLRRRTLKLPDWLLNADYETKVHFIAGLIDTDRSTIRQGGSNIATAKWWFAQDISVLLRSVGITHSIEPSWNKTYKKWYFRINITARDTWRHFATRLRRPDKKAKIHRPKFEYKNEKSNRVQRILSFEPGPLFDLSVDHETHLYYCNGLATHNTCNFLTGYGGGPLGLQNSLASNAVYLPFEKCENIVEEFFDHYPCLRRHINLYKDFITQHGVAVSIFGRVRVFQEVFGDDRAASAKALRSGYNHLIQSTASDLMLICMSVIEHLMREANLESMLVSTVHDSFVADCRINELDQVHEICRAVIKNIPEVLRLVFGDDYDDSWIIVPLDGDFEVGPNYLDQRRVIDDKPDWMQLLAPADNESTTPS